MSKEKEEKINELLGRLNYWTSLIQSENVADTGEVRSMIDNLKQQITKLGARIRWDKEKKRFEVLNGKGK